MELSWKILKRILGAKGIVVNSPKDVIRHAARERLIDAPERWFLFLEWRNLTSHTYDEGVANQQMPVRVTCIAAESSTLCVYSREANLEFERILRTDQQAFLFTRESKIENLLLPLFYTSFQTFLWSDLAAVPDFM